MFIFTFLISFTFSSSGRSEKRLNIHRQNKPVGNDVCDICKKAIDYIYQSLKDEKIEEEIIEGLDNLCHQYPTPYDSLCVNYVQQYIPLAIQWIESGIETNDICALLGLCSPRKMNIRSSKNKVLLFKNIFKSFPKDDNFPCQICKNFVEQLEAYLVDPNFLGSLDYFLDQVCGLIKVEYQPLCTTLVDYLIQWIMESLDETLDGLNICAKIQLCPDENVTALQRPKIVRRPHINKNIVGNDSCTICTITINYVDSKMKDKEVQEEIIAGLDGFCDTLSPLYVHVCRLIASIYVPLVMKLVDDGLETLDICNKLGFCTGQEVALRKSLYQKPLYLPKTLHKTTVTSGLCESCIATIDMVEKLLQDTKLESEIISILDQFCDTLPPDTAKACKDIAGRYVPLVIKLIETGIETLDICSKIGFCSSNINQRRFRIQRYEYKVDGSKMLQSSKPIKQIPHLKAI
ncbi:hypothetical protein M9Y10_005384 [Tritrichomonas musculus]|uniref:Saposin B-type domain-containing protein n=1 Tax=Tritrichomonas musculus TaxID=1915356 RepID=A0ABR2JL99_9EUKA